MHRIIPRPPRSMAGSITLALVTTTLLATPAAGEVTVAWVGEKFFPNKGLVQQQIENNKVARTVLGKARKLLGSVRSETGQTLEQSPLEQSNDGAAWLSEDYAYYTFGLHNDDQVRRATRVEMRAEFYDRRNNRLGERTIAFDLSLDPNQDTNLKIDCEEAACHESSRIALSIENTDFVELRYGNADEVVFGWNDRRWYLEDRWEESQTLVLRTFSGSYYKDQGYDGRVFSPGKLEHDKGRYYRLLREELPAGHGGSVGYELEESDLGFAYAYGLLPGFVVKEGQRAKPGFLDGEIGNITVLGRIAEGEFLKIRAVQVDKKALLLVLSPLCQQRDGHRSLRAKIRFVLDRQTIKGPDEEAIDRAIRQWLEPVPIGEVAKSCGPKSGTLVKRWTADTTPAQVENELGPADARVETADGEVLVYGTIKLEFKGDRLAGFEMRASS